jgi:hypothetical protein
MHQQHSGAEIGRTLAWIVAIVAFVIIALTWIPELIAPQGGSGAPDTGKTVKMIQ